LQKVARDRTLLRKQVFAKLEKPRVGQRDRVPTPEETATILSQASRQFRLIYSALRQSGARPGELCRATIADIDQTANAIILREHKSARKTGKPCRARYSTRSFGSPALSRRRPYVRLRLGTVHAFRADDRKIGSA